MGLCLTSSSFNQGDLLPLAQAYRRGNVSPALSWTGVPANTRSFAITCIDPDSNYGTFVHWGIFNISGTAAQLPEHVPNQGTLADGSKQVKNDYGEYGYGGPNPPRGQKHRYVFKLYALDVYFDQFSADTPNQELIKFLENHCIEQAEFFGYFQGL
jgi:Raf kinase inhibitor-like YbhB/YbcL family protein